MSELTRRSPPRVPREDSRRLDGYTRVPIRCNYARLTASSRRNHEDRAEVIEHAGCLVIAVADGAGGVRGGAAASDALVSAVTCVLAGEGLDASDPGVWEKLLVEVDANLARTMTGETTAVIAVVSTSGIIGVSVGDSQAGVVAEAGFDDLTAAQTKKRLGSGRASPVSFYRSRIEGTLVVGTDGLWNYTSLDSVQKAVRGREPEEAAERLRALVELPGRRYSDDLGIVVVRRCTGSGSAAGRAE